MPNTIKAIIFDCFGVLVESTLEPFCNKYIGDERVKLAHVKDLDDKANSGTISYDNFVLELAGLAKISDREAREFLDNNPPNIELLNFIADKLRPHFKIGLLSNASDNWLEELFTAEQLQLFDDAVLSYEHNLIKPDVAIFRLAAERLHVEPHECLFVDDVEAYCEGAKSAGMQTVHFVDYESFKQRLSELLK